jgi:glycosyltransferase involved in cell wall biosynthesis
MSYDDLPKVSLVIPCRNEERHIGTFLNTLVKINYPKDKLEIIFVDGKSEDKTRSIVESFRDKLLISIIDNEKKYTPFALNLGIKNSSGDYIVILSSHTALQASFVMDNIDTIKKTGADCVGGVIKTIAPTEGVFAKAISFALSNKFGVGNSLFRTGIDKITEADTVPYGCYKRSVFTKYGYFNEHLVRNQDIEFNLRIKKSGAKIILDPKIQTIYYSRSNLKELFKQNFRNGFWVFYSLCFAKLPFSIRHTIPSIFVGCLLLGAMFYFVDFFRVLFYLTLISYFLTNFYFSFKIARKEGFKYLIPTMLAFFTLHFSYGLGSIWGGIRYLLRGKKVKGV